MSHGKNFRLLLLGVTFSSVFLVLGKIVLYPYASSRTVTSFVFPPAVPLSGWQSLPSNPLSDRSSKHPNYITGRQYQYTQKDLPLNVEMRYVVNTTGDVKDFLKTYTSIPSSPILRQQEGIGFYGLFAYQGKAYLSSCVNPRGGSTVTDKQFKQNRNTYDLQLERLLPWFLGQKNLKDNRCLWVHLSIPLRDSSPDSAYQLLESAWSSWYQWWYPRFPKA